MTGTTGAMGLGVSQALTAAGHTVVGTVRSPRGAAVLGGLGATPVEVDLLDPRGLRAAIHLRIDRARLPGPVR